MTEHTSICNVCLKGEPNELRLVSKKILGLSTYRRLWIIGVKINSRLDDFVGILLKLFLSLVQDEWTAILLGFSIPENSDNPSLLCSIGNKRNLFKMGT